MLNSLPDKNLIMETGMVRNRLAASGTSALNEYMLVVHPDETVGAKVMAEKQQFSLQYNEQSAGRTKPYITVAGFQAREEMEPTLIRWMHRIISAQKKFNVTLNRYSGFPPHTIYLRVTDHMPFQALAKELQVVDQYVRSYDCPQMHFSCRPHMTIARRLQEDVYRQAEAEYANKDFRASFEVRELVLLRRTHSFDTCRQVNVFGLQP